ncbi:hypothetical protein [Estrella lausannensis]|uniref:Putative membrane protein n=1 Tax=Estrella lausannensis TaxID=483423 RepID=A0A0H5DT98_9BACT|nr:hypothetical protein [Estrella lausannensis]CRX39588.1 putative membrane protein [Estrella lausannensis]
MVNLFNRNCFNRLIFCSVFTSFTLTSSTPNYIAPVRLETFSEAAFMFRLERLVNKLTESKGKSCDKIIGYLVDVKREIESSYGLRFDLDRCMGEIENEIKKGGQKPPKKELDVIKSKIKKQDKKHKKHAEYLASTMYIENYEFNKADEELMLFDTRMGKDSDQRDEDDVELPSLLVYGVTVTLCGFFLMCLPIPVCKDWGGRMVVAGVTACANSISTKVDEDKKNKKKS